MKFRLFEKMQQRGTDLFIFHEHGDFDTQYINGGYPTDNVLEYSGKSDPILFGTTGSKHLTLGPMAALSIVFRNIYRQYNEIEAFKQSLISENGLTEDFFDQKLLDSTMVSDSIFAADINIHLLDLKHIKMQPKFTIFDACYNGSFHRPGYVAGYHVFGDGNTIVAQGNTVNVLQDKWSLELIGILGEGARIGFWQKEFQFLESHLIGDPTYMFKTGGSKVLNYNLAVKSGEKKTWGKYMKSKSPALQAMALKQLSKTLVPGYSAMLLFTLKSSPYYSVRMEALKRLIDICDDKIAEALAIGLNDPYELIRRNAARYAGYTGLASLIEPLVSTVLFSNESKRVQYAAQTSLMVMDPALVLKEIEKQTSVTCDSTTVKKIIEDFKKQYKEQEKAITNILDISVPEQKRISAIRNLRNYNYHRQVDALLTVLKDSGDKPAVRIAMAEALGWFGMSYKKTKILEAMDLLLQDDSLSSIIKSEVYQSYLRLM